METGINWPGHGELIVRRYDFNINNYEVAGVVKQERGGDKYLAPIPIKDQRGCRRLLYSSGFVSVRGEHLPRISFGMPNKEAELRKSRAAKEIATKPINPTDLVRLGIELFDEVPNVF